MARHQSSRPSRDPIVTEDRASGSQKRPGARESAQSSSQAAQASSDATNTGAGKTAGKAHPQGLVSNPAPRGGSSSTKAHPPSPRSSPDLPRAQQHGKQSSKGATQSEQLLGVGARHDPAPHYSQSLDIEGPGEGP